MSDLISRQAAIDAVEGLPNCYNGYSGTYDKACIIGVLEELPSAQPEIIRRKDCKWSYDDVGGRICSYGVCVDCVISDDFYCADAERRTDERSDR